MIAIGRELVRLNVIPAFPTESLGKGEFVHRSDPVFLEPLIILGTVDEPLHLQILMRDFDTTTGMLMEAGPNFDSRLEMKSVIREQLFPVGADSPTL